MKWVKSSFSGGQFCVEVAYAKSSFSGNTGSCVEFHEHNDQVHVRDSKDPNGPFLTFTAAEWDAFLQGAKAGELDRSQLV